MPPRKPRARVNASNNGGATVAEAAPQLPGGLTADDLTDFYRRMVLCRTIDERIWALNRQGKVPIAASSQGHEAAQLGSLLAAEKDGNCFLFPYYRDLALKFAAGLTAEQVMRSFMGKAGDPYSNGRQFPLQGADLPHNIIQISNVVAAGLTQSVGYAMACKMRDEGTVTLVYFVPQRKQMSIEEVASRAAGYGFPGFTIDGMDFIGCYEASREAISSAREQGPVLLEMNVERFTSHTTDDDDRRYRPANEVEQARLRDPVVTFGALLMEHGVMTQEEIDEAAANALAAVDAATDAADVASPPDVSTLHALVYSG
ncbi:2-oxoisovalerate dehydrogenase subunit alpha [Geodia barretti]|uniref:2-oxoisovalerate dehydrogenase subunit alpha n=1 Tax=Geodia barretti TaxID=519541 RepID=A0AA35W8V1_GEOBA|nr:2-oxoisovalerate dehydrogenase subunit alpha [Geodia barretti]